MATVRISARLPVDLSQQLEDQMTINKDNEVDWTEIVSKLEKGLEILEMVKIVNSLPKLNERN
jgi:hypothetical protein